MLLFLFLLSNFFVTVIIDRNETNGKNKQKHDYYMSSQTKKKTKGKESRCGSL